MTKSFVIGVGALALCSTALAKGGGGEWDAKGAAEIKAIVEKGY